ncbi:hypothetical protein ACE0DR_22465 [Azotobacter sp. CWF10]
MIERDGAAVVMKRDCTRALIVVSEIEGQPLKQVWDSILTNSRQLRSADERFMLIDADHRAVECFVNYFENLDSNCICFDFRPENVQAITIDNLGLSQEERNVLAGWAKAKSGFILVAGMIGSGKASTSDALLQLAAKDSGRIVYRVDRLVGVRTPGVHSMAVDMHNPWKFVECSAASRVPTRM